ncbi:DUF1836 domain-containing protein [Oscillibacter sp. MSJ-2]|uniref:DUF1836 domain-containing protein n=1 Tax=Dysosmobacter acutus TaxID=2841504 RepID=A0ABS6F6X7_9FIRM|nr:DUF1836 domain-containing protein [Dysosmobacter acutus]MBU5625805.1 DUF1836 domain-containing protein [Dysosmobacter acutus]
MDELHALQEVLRAQRPVEWDQLPDIPLYMDQVLSYMDRQSIRVDEGDALTSAMVNNYTKSGLVPRAEGKKYGREHLAYLTAICALKQVMSARDMALIIGKETEGSHSVEEMYQRFRASLDQALEHAAGEMEPYLDEEKLADGAVHFALLSYAAGVASRRYVNVLRSLEPESKRKK